MLKKLLLVIILVSLCGAANAYDGFGKKQPYAIAIHLSNPIGLMSKYGGGLEFRYRGVSLLGNYYKYNAVYPGWAISGELQFFLNSPNRHQFYIYGKGVYGQAGYNGNELGFLNYSTNIVFPSFEYPLTVDYVGGGAGMGRRYNFGHFFVALSAGFKYCAFTSTLPPAELHMYNLFYDLGPGAYADLHLQFGLQF